MAQKSKIDMQKEFDLQDINQKAEPTQPTAEQLQKFREAAERTLQYRKRTVKTMFNADFFPVQGEVNTKPSLTIPDQTLPIREILARFAKGLPVGVKTPVYEGEDNDLPDPRTLDLVDIQNMQEAIRDELQAIERKTRQTKEKSKEVNQEETKPI